MVHHHIVGLAISLARAASYGVRFVGLVSGQYSPHDPGRLVRHGDSRKPRWLSLQQLRQPGVGALGVGRNLPDARCHTDNDKLA